MQDTEPIHNFIGLFCDLFNRENYNFYPIQLDQAWLALEIKIKHILN